MRIGEKQRNALIELLAIFIGERQVFGIAGSERASSDCLRDVGSQWA
ncbi:Uncharacterised protein [Vibrio cholerae]|nr:Uncharacterised protein [Vibrio cholerae]CSB87418.1 Uncharacterised protein [Vibrio cholerae]CSC73790.1 Uncharacterised protein [Vibrio cholerae]CSD26918.1 Uncharacterised protein [Vibrio cholerae]CSI55167.1 Uncharacterised protein [Vibrio cholerae]